MVLPDTIESALIDKWTPVHAATGFFLGRFLKRNWRQGIPIIIAFELIENAPPVRSFLKEQFGFTGKETVGNAVVDIAVGLWFLRLGSEA